MLRYFNSLQITALFSAMPFLIGWLHGAEFPGVVAAYWAAIALYIVTFFAHVGCVAYTMGRQEDWW